MPKIDFSVLSHLFLFYRLAEMLSYEYFFQSEKGEAAFEAMKDVYMKNINPDSPLKYSQLHGEVFSDAVFIIPSILTAKAHASR